MAEKNASAAGLAKINGGVISKQKAPVGVGQLERALFSRFPLEDAEDWDRMGLIVGNPSATVTGVLVALDPTVAAVEAAQGAGANVLLTHHPVFLEPPERFLAADGILNPGSVVYEAIARGVSLMNFHTALDASEEAAKLLPGLLSLDFRKVLVPLPSSKKKGYGQYCTVRKSDAPLSLEQLAARCVAVFGCAPRVWGPTGKEVRTVVIANGSASNVVEACLQDDVDCLICGELRYHSALEASQSGLSIIELGHDISEFPLTALLAKAAMDAGVPKKDVSIFEQNPNWITPEATRI